MARTSSNFQRPALTHWPRSCTAAWEPCRRHGWFPREPRVPSGPGGHIPRPARALGRAQPSPADRPNHDSTASIPLRALRRTSCVHGADLRIRTTPHLASAGESRSRVISRVGLRVRPPAGPESAPAVEPLSTIPLAGRTESRHKAVQQMGTAIPTTLAEFVIRMSLPAPRCDVHLGVKSELEPTT